MENVPRNPPKPYRKKQIEAEKLVLDLRNDFYEKFLLLETFHFISENYIDFLLLLFLEVEL